MEPPVLRTDRLLLSAHAPADLPDLAAMWGDPAVTVPTWGRTFSREEAWARLLRYVGHWRVAGHGQWAVRLREDGRYLGEVGLMDQRRETEPRLDGAPEAGWAFAGDAGGRGYAREAVAAMLAWADSRPPSRAMPRTVCLIRPGNARSIRLAQAVGYRAEGEVLYDGRASLLFGRAARGRGAPPVA